VCHRIEQAAPNNVNSLAHASFAYDHLARVQLDLGRNNEAMQTLR
jgi:hypothetical protein